MDFIQLIEYLGTAAFAISGVLTAAEKKLDLFGVTTLGVTTAVGGGLLRDIILGIHPPLVFRDYSYVLTAFFVSLISFVILYFDRAQFVRQKAQVERLLNIFDAIGLGIFIVTGADTAIQNGYGDNIFLVLFVAVMTGIGGGILRDMMAGEIPFVLYKRVYAVAAIIGGCVYYWMYPYDPNAAIFVSVFTTLLIRLLAARFRWNLPKIVD